MIKFNKKSACILIFVILLYVLITFIFTYPLFFKIDSFIPGFHSTDEPYAFLWDSWRIKHALPGSLSVNFTDLIRYPFGADLYSSKMVSFLNLIWVHLLGIFTTPILSYNIQAILNIVLMALLSYFLVFYLIKDRGIAIFSGIIFAFCPYEFARIWQHISLTYNQWIPLMLFTAFLLKDRTSKKNISLFFTSLILALSFDFSIMYFTAITMLVFIAYAFFHKADLKYLKKIIIIGLFAFVALSPQFFPIFNNMIGRLHSSAAGGPGSSAWNFYQRPFEDLFTQSARPLSYFLPAAVHPLFGKFTEQFIGTGLYGTSFTEHTLYLGWVPMILAFVAFRKWRRNKKSQVNEKDDFYIGFFVFLAIAAWLFSQPPWWDMFGFKLYMPSFFMYKLLPMYRAYCRFGIVVMLAVAVLAGFGLKFILEKFKSSKIKTAVTILACALVLFEFWNWPPHKVIDVSRVPAVYYWLKNQPKDIVIAEYPLDSDSPNEMYKFYQTVHEKKIINGTIPGTPANKFAQTIIKLSEPRTIAALKGIGVNYILVHKDKYLQSGLIEDEEEFKKIPSNKSLKFLKDFPAQNCPSVTMCTQHTGPVDVYTISADTPEIKPDIETKI